MSGKGGFDMSDVYRLTQQLVASDGPVRDGARASIKKGATNVKTDAQARIRAQTRGRYTKHYPRAIDFDILDDGLAAEIGPSAGRRQAFLGKILEFGTATSSAHPHLIPAVEAEQDNISDGMARAVVEAMRKALES